jgi:hypothetical protein
VLELVDGVVLVLEEMLGLVLVVVVSWAIVVDELGLVVAEVVADKSVDDERLVSWATVEVEVLGLVVELVVSSLAVAEELLVPAMVDVLGAWVVPLVSFDLMASVELLFCADVSVVAVAPKVLLLEVVEVVSLAVAVLGVEDEIVELEGLGEVEAVLEGVVL